jgi:hypothetical protein
MFASPTSVARVVAELRDLVSSGDAQGVSGADAKELVASFAAGKRLCEAAIALLAPRVEAAGTYATSGHRSCAEWLAAEAGESRSRSQGRLEAARVADALPELKDAFRRGEVSSDQVSVIAGAASLAPRSVGSLLSAAKEGFPTLCEKAKAVRSGALSREDQQRQAARVHRARHLRTCVEPTGGVRGSFFLPEATWARCEAALKPLTDRFFEQARKSGAHEPVDRYRADALVALLTDSRSGKASTRPGALVSVHVDAAALQRGAAKGDELCYIDGIGPVSVPALRSLLDDCLYEVVVTKGAAVATVSSKDRTISARTRSAVNARDRHCRWPGCTDTVAVQNHHWGTDYRFGGPNTFDNLVLVCARHHDMCTIAGWRLEVRADGSVRAIPPPDPLTAAQIERRRKVTKERNRAARASAAGRAPPIS